MATTPKIACGKCGNDLRPGDKFCGACGTSVAWSDAAPAPSTAVTAGPPASASPIRCPLCGHENPGAAFTCESCGNALPGRTPPAPKPRKKGGGAPRSSAPAPLTFLQSWKFVAMIGAILIVAIVVYKNSQPAGPASATAPAPAMSANAAAAVEQIEALQRELDANPNDAEKTLRLANMLHDVRMYPRASAMYARYLQMNPSNPDARVDLGTTYFELSMTDTARRVEYLRSAKAEMEKAITYAPRHQLAHFNLGIISLHDGDLDGAMRWFSKCVAIDSTTEAAKRASQLLHQHTLTNP